MQAVGFNWELELDWMYIVCCMLYIVYYIMSLSSYIQMGVE